MAVLIDTSFLVAVASKKDARHIIARRALDDMNEEFVVPAPVLPEMFFMINERVNYVTAVAMFTSLQSDLFHIEPLNHNDMGRMRQIMEKYADNKFDFVDTSIMALSERLEIEDVYTLDQRDFSGFSPETHCLSANLSLMHVLCLIVYPYQVKGC